MLEAEVVLMVLLLVQVVQEQEKIVLMLVGLLYSRQVVQLLPIQVQVVVVVMVEKMLITEVLVVLE